ncbi:Golgi membrane protein 1 isoform X2 [Hippoglossus hippoglossus]|uniref:Golgi membrane protein 1 isoform X2 n=1 Tax=Hippoglossus hippoglossus TaxID=8267 RepID=UPI00148E1BE7|nr:Golgi membrane protein 1 isoform X2 [Hippoglossus hippoglossus]
MGGLGNGRRGGRSPPLMIGALIACILVLGFNYWVCSSRNLELQTKLYEMEGQVRRGAAERGVSEIKKNEFQEEIQRQKEEISQQESLYKRQLEALENSCNQEKETLQENMSSSSKTTQELKGQLNQLNEEVGELQRELQSCQGNINTLNSKLTYDMTQCHSQVLSQKELCDERVAAAKLEVQKKMEKLISSPSVVSSQEKTMDQAGKADRPVVSVADPDKNSTVVSHTPSVSRPKENEPTELLTNEIIVDQGSDDPVPSVNDVSQEELQSVPSATAVKQDILPPLEGAVKTNEAGTETSKLMKNNLTEDKDMEFMDVHEEGTQTEDPGMEGMLIGQGKVDEMPDGQKLEPEEYDTDNHIVGGADLKKQQQIKRAENIDKDMEEELADYNGDDENEGEFEADKQAELAQH